MSASTVKGRAPGMSGGGALVRRLEELDPARAPDQARLDALGVGLVDALLNADGAALERALEALRGLRARAVAAEAPSERLQGWLEAALGFAYWGVERLGSESGGSVVAEGTHAWEFINALRETGRAGSTELRELLGVDETEVSRTGRRLLEAGLVSRSKVGRQALWALTPRGRHVLGGTAERSHPASKQSDRALRSGGVGADFWLAAIRQGFEGVAGDEPATGLRTVDPTRERIVECTLELHKAQGIPETTFEQVAQKAGIAMETLESYFPTPDELVQGCGRHALTRLRLPPPDRAREVFSGAASEPERVHTLVETLFDVYEREGESLERGRQARSDMPIIDEAFDQVDAAVDALVAEALKPLDPDAVTIASVRALTDLEVWRALRDAGASPAASVEDASAALGRWLDTQATRIHP
jgi:AcrR family transcriptional regulator/DNA-binding transcriptional ArsR family regulator